MTDKAVGSIGWLADILGDAWAPLNPPPLAPVDPGSIPGCSATPLSQVPDLTTGAPSTPLLRVGGKA